MSVALIAVVTGEDYIKFSRELFASAAVHFRPDGPAECLRLYGRSGWPAATLYRYHVLLEHEPFLEGYSHIFLCDADMRFEESVGEEVLGSITATQHPGYVRARRSDLPFEDRKESRAYVAPAARKTYFCGGFVGGEREDFLLLAKWIRSQIDQDSGLGITARWHDESHLNSVLTRMPPTNVLSPAYCHPDDDSVYLERWPEAYARKLVAIDKTPTQRGAR